MNNNLKSTNQVCNNHKCNCTCKCHKTLIFVILVKYFGMARVIFKNCIFGLSTLMNIFHISKFFVSLNTFWLAKIELKNEFHFFPLPASSYQAQSSVSFWYLLPVVLDRMSLENQDLPAESAC